MKGCDICHKDRENTKVVTISAGRDYPGVGGGMSPPEKIRVCEWCEAEKFLNTMHEHHDIEHFEVHVDEDPIADHIYVEINQHETLKLNGYTGVGHPVSKVMSDYGFLIKRFEDDGNRIWLTKP